MITLNKFKLLFLFWVPLLLAGSGKTQTPGWLWARGSGSFYNDGNTIACDNAGNTWMTGTFAVDSVVFDSVTLHKLYAVSGCVAHFNASGHVIWAKAIHCSSDLYVLGVDHDGNGNCYVSGYFAGELYAGSVILTSYGVRDFFILRMDANGNVVWAKNGGGTADDFVFGQANIAVSGSGEVVFTGTSFGGTFYLDGDSLTGNVSSDMILIKLDSAGQLNWMKSLGGAGFDFGAAAGFDAAGNIYAAGNFESFLINMGDTTFHAFGSKTIGIAKFTPGGYLDWARSFGGEYANNLHAMDISEEGNILLAATYVGRRFNADGYSFSCFDSVLYTTDSYTALLGPDGNTKWIKWMGNNWADYCMGAHIGPDGECYVCGSFESTEFQGEAFYVDGDTLFTNGLEDFYVVRFDSSGKKDWAISAGGLLNEIAWDIETDSLGNLYVTGVNTSSPLPFGSIHLVASGVDLFLAKMDRFTGILPPTASERIELFPNPSSGEASLQCSRTPSRIEVYDISGRKVLEFFPENRLCNMSLKTPGLYTVVVWMQDTRLTEKWIVSE